MTKLRHRSVLEIMVLTFMSTVALMLALMGIAIVAIKMRDPDADVDTITQSLVSLTSGILGALLGLLAGKSEAVTNLDRRTDDTDTGLDEENPP